MTTNPYFTPKDVKRHWTGGVTLVTNLLHELLPNQQFLGPNNPESTDRTHWTWIIESVGLEYTKLDLQFNSEEQFRHSILKMKEFEEWQ